MGYRYRVWDIFYKDIDMTYELSIWDMVYRYGDAPYRYGHPGYRYGIWANDMAYDSIDTVILDIDMGYLVTLVIRCQLAPRTPPGDRTGGDQPRNPVVAARVEVESKDSKAIHQILASSADTKRGRPGSTWVQPGVVLHRLTQCSEDVVRSHEAH